MTQSRALFLFQSRGVDNNGVEKLKLSEPIAVSSRGNSSWLLDDSIQLDVKKRNVGIERGIEASKGEMRASEHSICSIDSPDITNGRFCPRRLVFFLARVPHSTLPRSSSTHQPERWNARVVSPEKGKKKQRRERGIGEDTRTQIKREKLFFLTEKERERA